MNTVNATQFRGNLFKYLGLAIEDSEILNITTKKGSVVLMSEDNYNSLMETLHLNSIPGFAKELLNRADGPTEDWIAYNKNIWEEDCVPDNDIKKGL
jgi:PHD/YefM family antitoxin component YafN of YafNO toxin-antitoxin module